MKFIFVILSVSLSSYVTNAADSLGAQGVLQFSSATARQMTEEKLQNPKEIMNHFKISLDSSTRILSPMTIGGTTTHPVMKVSVEKCVLLVCQKANLDIEFAVQIVPGKCELNAMLVGDLSRSSSVVSELYKQLRISICYSTVANQGGELRINGEVVRSSTYATGIVQSQLFQMLKRQFPAVLEALRLSFNGKVFLQTSSRFESKMAPLF